MKLRKSIAAGVAAVAMTFASTSVATAQDAQDTTIQVVEGAGETNQKNEKPTTSEAEGSSDVTSKEILGWISVATAAIGALGTLITFVQKFIVK